MLRLMSHWDMASHRDRCSAQNFTHFTHDHSGNIIRHHKLDVQFYADDTQLYVSFMNSDHEEDIAAVTRLNDCIRNVRTWLTRNMLKTNDEKMEVILFTSKHGLKSLSNITNQHLNMSQHVRSIRRTGYYHLRNIGRIRRIYITLDATKTLIHALVTSRLDYCNSLLYGLPANHLAEMQRLHNACARVITRTGRRSHITPVLKEMHWLPVHRRIQYKILSHTYRAYIHTTNRRST